MSISETAALGVKFDDGKPRMDLIDSYAEEQLARVLTFGAKKYAPHNWRKGIKLSRLIAAARRHLNSFAKGEDLDPETQLQHAAHLMCTAMFMVWTVQHRKDMDDRWKADPRNTKEWLSRLRVPADAATLSNLLPHEGQETESPDEAYSSNTDSER